MTTQEKIAVMQAWCDGKTIQAKSSDGEWVDCITPSWYWAICEYRIKPEPKEPTYRPYKDFAEFRAEWFKHGGWVKDSIDIYIKIVYRQCEADDYLKKLVWMDDNTPCGIKLEE